MGLPTLKFPKEDEKQNGLVFLNPPKAPPQKINDNTPGFQWSNNSLTRGLSRAFDQVNTLDSGRTWQQRTPTAEDRNRSILGQMTHNAVTNTVGNLWKPVQNVGEYAITEPVRSLTAQVTDNRAAQIAAEQRKAQALRDSVIGATGRTGWEAIDASIVNPSKAIIGQATGNPIAQANAQADIVPSWNQTAFGRVWTPLQHRLAENQVRRDMPGLTPEQQAQMIAYNKARAGLSPDASIGQQLIDTGLSALELYGTARAPVAYNNPAALVTDPLDALRAGRVRVGNTIRDIQENGIPRPNLGSLIPQGNEAGFIQIGRTPKNIHPDDVKIMSDFLDYTRGVKKLDERQAYNLELDASRIAEYYGISPMGGRNVNPTTRLANAFDDRIMTQRQQQRGRVYNPVTRQWIKDPGFKEGGYVRVGKEAKTPEAPAVSVRSNKKPEKVQVEPAKNGVLQEVKRGLSDTDQVILDELRSIEKQTGQVGLVDKFMYLSNQQRGSNRVANVMLERSKNVKKAIGKQNKSQADAFSEYANARSELAWAKRQRTPTGRQKKIRTSRPMAELEQIVSKGGRDNRTRFKALNEHYKELTQMATDAGIIDKKTAAAYKANNDYIRIQRDLEDKIPTPTGGRGQGYQLGSTTLKQKRKGSERATLDAAEVAAERTQQIHREAAKNKSGRFLVDTLEKAGLAKRVSPTKASTLNTVGVFKNGQKQFYEVSPAIKEAIDNINPYQMNVVMQVLATPGRVFRAGVTGLNPVFIARNLVKDQFGSAINSKNILATHNPKTFFSGLFAATKDAFGGKNSALYDEFLKHYGDQTSFDLTRNVKNTKDVIAGIRGGRKVRVLQKFKSPIRSLEDIASITEKSTRYQNFKGSYKKALKDGMSKDQAMEFAAIQAWQNSVDFARAGTWGRVINTVLPYWNPSTQGVRQMARTFKDRPVSSTFKTVALVGVPMVAATAWALSDPDTKAVYDNIPEYEKDNNIILIPPGTKQNEDGTYDVFKVPLPPGFKDAVMPLRRAMEAAAGDKKADFTSMFQDILQTVAGPVQTGSMGQFAGSFIPQVAKPAVQSAANQDFFTGGKIVPDYMNEATDAQGNPVADKDKAYKNTSGTARQLGSMFGLSPIKVEKFIKDTGGSVGLNLLNLADNLQASAGTIPKEQIGGQSVPEGFTRSFASAQGIENFNKSEGAKYFDTLTRLSNETKLTQAEKDAWGALHPAKKNFLDEEVYDRDPTYDPAARLDIYNRFPKVYELDKKLDAEQRKNGKPGNPLYDLEQWQLKKVLEKENLPPGAKDPELTNLYKQEWYQDYRLGKTEFFNKLKADADKEGRQFGSNDNPYPDTPEDVQRAMDMYNGLEKGTGARSAWIRSNQGMWLRMQQYFAAVDNWQNIARGKRGLDMTEGELGRMAGYGEGFSSSYGSGSSGELNPAKFIQKFSTGGNVTKGTPRSTGRVSVKARPSGGRGGRIKVTSKKLRLA